MSLIELAKNIELRTDKYDLGYITEFYNALFEPKRLSNNLMLEIGIDKGYSIMLWKSYFPNANIIAVDIQNCELVNNQDRIFPMYCNAYDEKFIEKFKDNSFDIIIDDGPHTYDSMIFFVQHYLKKVKSGGILVLEDIIEPSWTPNLVKLIDPLVGRITVHDMREKQLDPRLRDLWRSGLDVIVVEKN